MDYIYAIVILNKKGQGIRERKRVCYVQVPKRYGKIGIDLDNLGRYVKYARHERGGGRPSWGLLLQMR